MAIMRLTTTPAVVVTTSRMHTPTARLGEEATDAGTTRPPETEPTDDDSVPAAAPAAAATDVSASRAYALGAPVAVGATVLLLGAYHSFVAWPAPLKVSGDVSVFALLYIAAQSIERALEPFTNLVVRTDDIKKELDRRIATALQTRAKSDAEDAAKKQDELDKRRGERALLWWAVATILGMVASGLTGLYFVGLVLAPGSAVPQWFDALVTGLVVGGGSKPLHDLIERIQKSKEQTEDPPETNPKT